MKVIGLSVLILSCLTGCAMSAPKEDTRDIFMMVKQRNFDGAKKKIQNNSKGLMGTFATYDGEALDPANQGHSADNITGLIEGAQYTVNFCDKKVLELRNIHGNEMSSDEDQQFSFTQELTNSQEEFERECVKEPSEDWSSIQKIRKYATVDLFPLLTVDKSQFDKELTRINSELSARRNQLAKSDLDANVAQKKYEQSAEFYAKKLCEMLAIATAAKSNIREENDAAKNSGFIDKVKMYENGRALKINKDRIKHFSSEYQSKFGKSWSPHLCK